MGLGASLLLLFLYHVVFFTVAEEAFNVTSNCPGECAAYVTSYAYVMTPARGAVSDLIGNYTQGYGSQFVLESSPTQPAASDSPESIDETQQQSQHGRQWLPSTGSPTLSQAQRADIRSWALSSPSVRSDKMSVLDSEDSMDAAFARAETAQQSESPKPSGAGDIRGAKRGRSPTVGDGTHAGAAKKTAASDRQETSANFSGVIPDGYQRLSDYNRDQQAAGRVTFMQERDSAAIAATKTQSAGRPFMAAHAGWTRLLLHKHPVILPNQTIL